LLFISCETSIKEYKPKNENEKQIIALLNTYVEARNSGNLKILRSTFHDNGIYISGRGREIKANEILDTKPEWWTSDGDVKLYQMEVLFYQEIKCLNGNPKIGQLLVLENYTILK
jgi:hypothetical protein